MSEEQINIAIAEVCGVQPELIEWWAYKDTPDGGSICYSAQSKEEIEKWLASLPEGSWAKDYLPKAFYKYPNYSDDFNAMHEALMIQTTEFRIRFRKELKHIIAPETKPSKIKVSGICLMGEAEYDLWFHATARQRAEAFLRTIGKWKEEMK